MLNIHYLHHVAITITDLERAKAFYGGVLGLTELPIRGIDSNRAWYQAGPCQVNLIVQEKPTPNRRVILHCVLTAYAKRGKHWKQEG